MRMNTGSAVSVSERRFLEFQTEHTPTETVVFLDRDLHRIGTKSPRPKWAA